MRRLVRGIGYGLSAIALAILVLAGATARPGDPALWPPKPGEPATEIFVVSHGYHSGIALSTAQLAAVARRSGDTALGLIAERFGGYPFIEVGWGEQDFYASVPTAADLNVGLAVRALLVNSQTTLPVALDEVLSLARQVAAQHDESVALGLRIRTIFEDDNRWARSLGPHRLTHEEISVEEAFDLVPAEVWWDVLAMIVRLLPGIGPDSIARDYGNAPPGGIHKVFDRTLEELANLLLRTRSLVVIDWRFNREVHAVVRQHMIGLGEDGDRQ